MGKRKVDPTEKGVFVGKRRWLVHLASLRRAGMASQSEARRAFSQDLVEFLHVVFRHVAQGEQKRNGRHEPEPAGHLARGRAAVVVGLHEGTGGVGELFAGLLPEDAVDVHDEFMGAVGEGGVGEGLLHVFPQVRVAAKAPVRGLYGEHFGEKAFFRHRSSTD